MAQSSSTSRIAAASVHAEPSLSSTVGSPGGVRSVHRALLLLQAMSARDRPEWSLDQLSRATALPKPTTHRLLDAMVRSSFVERSARPGFYRLGLATAIVGNASLQARRPEGGVARVLADLSSRTRETVELGLLSGPHAVSIARVRPGDPMDVGFLRGGIIPAHASCGGKVLLAGRRPDEVRNLYGGHERLTPFTPKTIPTVTALLHQLGRVREQGYAIDDEEYESGVRCVGVPVPSAGTATRHWLTMAVPTARAEFGKMRIHVRILRVAALRLSEVLT
jgi:IclR family transcriptional regulator, acetate operon repressor